MVYTFNSYEEFSSNVYVITNDFNEAIIIDPGFASQKIRNFISNYNVEAILLTHGHFDHINGINKLNKLPDIYCGEEEDFLRNPKKNGSNDFNLNVNVEKKFNYLNEGILKIGHFEINCYLLKGHTSGGFAFYFKNEKSIFFGDTIFKDGIGRYDLYSGSYKDLKESIYKIKSLFIDDNTMCYFGHGDNCNYKQLRLYNDYLK